jgi:hypothetical protein
MSFGSQRRTVDAQAAAGRQHRRRSGTTRPSVDIAMAGNASNHAVSQALRGGSPLDPQIRAEMQARFGESFADVRVHDNAQAHRGADALDAKAYTVGNDITFNAHRYVPHSGEGKRLLAHELAHVVQQRRGGSSPALDTNAPHEAAAEHAADAVVRGAGAVNVGVGTAVGVARDPKDRKRKSKALGKTGKSPVKTGTPKAPAAKKPAADAFKSDVEIKDPVELRGKHILEEVYGAPGRAHDPDIQTELADERTGVRSEASEKARHADRLAENSRQATKIGGCGPSWHPRGES